MAIKKTLPNFFILGAAKAGTTSIYHSMRTHPEVFFPFKKETLFFSHDAAFQRGIDWYASNYFEQAGEYAWRGEATPHYLYWAEKVAPRIRNAYPETEPKFIVLLRNPMERAYSWFLNMTREGREDLDFLSALQKEDKRLKENRAEFHERGSMIYGYAQGGRYAAQLSVFMDLFSKDAFHVILHDDLKADYALTVEKISPFLQLSQPINPERVVSNPASAPIFPWLQKFVVNPSGPAHSLVKVFTHLLPEKWRYRLKKTVLEKNLAEKAFPGISQKEWDYLQSKFTDEISKLENLLGKDLSHWRNPYNSIGQKA